MKTYNCNFDNGEDFNTATVKANSLIEAKKLANMLKRRNNYKGRTFVKIAR